MINKQRVQRIRAMIYVFLILLVFIPVIVMICIGVKSVNMLTKLTEQLTLNPPALTQQLPPQNSGGDAADPPVVPQSQPEGDDSEPPAGQNLGGGESGRAASGLDGQNQNQASTGGGGYVENTYLPSSYPQLHFDTVPVFAPPSENTLYLTFDNTPSYRMEEILDVLQKHDVRATFFVWWNDSMGNANIDFYKRLVADGHQIGIHSASNGKTFSQLYSSVDDFLREFDEMFDIIAAETGVKPRMYRLPGGSINPHDAGRQAVLNEIKTELDARGFVQYDWTASAQDAVPYSLSKDEVLRNIKRSISEDSRAVILAHDGTLSSATAQALDELIGEYKSQGYTFGVLEDSTQPVSFLQP